MEDDGDDFDLFFNTKKTKTTGQSKFSKSSDPMDDLFGIEENNPTIKKGTTTAAKTSSTRIREQLEDEDDDLGFDPKKPKALNKSQNLFDDLLAPIEAKRHQSATATTTKAPISRQSTDTTTDTSNILQNQVLRPKTSQGRRTSNITATANTDPLGLFSKDKDTSKPSSIISSPKMPKRGTANWLGLAVEPEPETTVKATETVEQPKAPNITKTSSKEISEILKLPDNIETTERQLPENPLTKEHVKAEDDLMLNSTTRNIILMNSLNMEAKQSFAALKYQDQQLVMAAQMKQQEHVLMDMQRKQGALLQQQEKQFQQLFQQQMQRQQQLEQLINQQQQRISQHLQLMMTQPALTTVLTDNVMQESSNKGQETSSNEEEISQTIRAQEKATALELIQLESDNKRLELENLRLEELIANTKSNYEREIELLEKSYK